MQIIRIDGNFAKKKSTIITIRPLRGMKSIYNANNVGIFGTKDYEQLNVRLSQWHSMLEESYDLCVMLARKGPRLNECEEKIYSKPKVKNVITENALPFIDFNNIKRCVVADEAVYNGTTFDKIFQIVRQSVNDGVEVNALPFVVTRDAIANLSNVFNSEQLIIEDNCINFFIDTVISRFQQLGKPYDIDFPLLYGEMNPGFNDDDMVKIARELIGCYNKSLPERFHLKYYEYEYIARETGERTKSVSIVLDGLFATAFVQGSKPDFAKIRLMRRENRLCIAFMTPYLINDYDLTLDSGLFEGELLDVWNIIMEAANKYCASDEECLYQKKKSLVIMANYLLSFEAYKMISSQLDSILSKYGCTGLSIDEQDLAYLIGWELATITRNKLMSCDIQYYMPKPTLLPVEKKDRVIPDAFEKNYLSVLAASDYGMTCSVGARLSNMFSIMHSEVELKSRKFDKGFGRLRFGESYKSIYDRYSGGLDSSLVWQDINKGMDRRIDRGSVVPNYVNISVPSYSYWIRLFRSGENEDLLRDQVSRIVGFIVREFLVTAGGRTVPVDNVELAISLLSMRPVINNKIFANRLRFDVLSHGIQSFIELDGGNEEFTSVINIAERCGMVSSTFGDLSFNSNCYSVKGGISISKDTEEEVKKAVRNVNEITKEMGFPESSSELLNFLQYHSVGVFDKVKDFNNLIQHALNTGVSDIDYELVTEKFVWLFKIYPDETLGGFADILREMGRELEAQRVDTVLDEIKQSNGFRLLVTSYYILNIWYRLNTGKNLGKITPYNVDLFLKEFHEEEREKLSVIGNSDDKEFARLSLVELLQSKTNEVKA